MGWLLLHARRRGAKLVGCVGLCLALVGCGVFPAVTSADPTATAEAEQLTLQQATQRLLDTPVSGQAWLPFPLPGKSFAPFKPVVQQGRASLQVQARHSVSILRQRFAPALTQVGTLAFSWKVEALPGGADLKDASSADAPVRILLAFDGDPSRWTARTHRLSEMSRLLTGEPLPYATLSYVWSGDDPVGSVLMNPRTDRIRKLVVESGTGKLGRWLDYERDVRADFIRAFGEEPGPLLAVALMTDTDNTQSTLRAWYGALRLDARP